MVLLADGELVAWVTEAISLPSSVTMLKSRAKYRIHPHNVKMLCMRLGDGYCHASHRAESSVSQDLEDSVGEED